MTSTFPSDKKTATRQNLRPLWRCPRCGARFITKNIWHSCGKYTLNDLFARSEPHVLKLFKKFERMVRSCGRVIMIPQKTRVVFMVRVRFVGAYPRKSHFLAGFALSRRLKSPRIKKIEEYAPHFIGHLMDIRSEADLDAELKGWIRESLAVGAQRRLPSSYTIRALL
jgi:hypothetical protein